jgi:hypothetical protein
MPPTLEAMGQAESAKLKKLELHDPSADVALADAANLHWTYISMLEARERTAHVDGLADEGVRGRMKKAMDEIAAFVPLPVLR